MSLTSALTRLTKPSSTQQAQPQPKGYQPTTKAGKSCALLLSRFHEFTKDAKAQMIMKAFGVSGLDVIVESIDKSEEGRRIFADILNEINAITDDQ